MSVIVKDMEMPRICGECRGHFLSGDGHVCCNLTNRIPKIVAKFNNNMMDLVARKESIDSVVRPDWCPLVELPEKHGPLIDRNELEKAVLKWLPPDPCGREEKEYPFETDICVSMMMEIEEQETIVEADGD